MPGMSGQNALEHLVHRGVAAVLKLLDGHAPSPPAPLLTIGRIGRGEA
jgi:hypothetical protein